MDSVNFLNLMDNFEAGKEGEREKEREQPLARVDLSILFPNLERGE